MEEQKNVRQSGEGDFRHKLGGDMRRLLEMDEKTIHELINTDDQRLLIEKKRIIEEIDRAIPPQIIRPGAVVTPGKLVAAEMENLRTRLLQMRMKELQPHTLVAVIDRAKLPKVRVRAIVNFTGNRKDLEGLGLQVKAQAQDIFTIRGTPDQLRSLAAQSTCQRLRTPRVFFPVVENASAQAEIADVHDPRPLNPNGFQGAGIAVGVIDSALEVTHHTFRDPGGAHGSRVLYYWVQVPYTRDATGSAVTANLATLPGDSPADWTAAAAAGTRPNFAPFTDGRLYTQAAIDTAIGLANPYGTGNNQICCEPWYDVTPWGIDTEHGTHCAGIAAGNGRETNWNTNPTHVGAAPQATIIYVRSGGLTWEDYDGTWEDSILEAIAFCLEAARFHNMPVAISISQATNFGPHNGASDFDQGIDNLLDSFFDRSVVIAAGNDNDDNGYRGGSLAANSSFNFTITDNGNIPCYTDIWYSGPELDYRLSFGGANSGWRTSGQDYDGTVGGEHIVVDRDADLGGTLRNIRIFFEDARTGDTYTIDLRNQDPAQAADYHIYTGIQGQHASVSGSSQGEHTLGDSACCKSVLTVGACEKINPATPASGETIAGYSGAGPTLDGRVKPEIVAVGSSVVSAASDENNGWVSMGGTSMATPLVAGAVALLFDAYGRAPLNLRLNQDTIKGLLIQNSNRLNLDLDPALGGYDPAERNLYGNGRLRMIDAIDLSLANPVDVDVWIRTADDDYGDEPYIGDCFCGAPDIRVCEVPSGNETTQINWGTSYDVKVTVRNLGDSNAVGATVVLKYTTPHTAPNSWFEAEDASDNKLSQTVTVDAMNQRELTFRWRPEASELGAPAGQTHFCLLAEVDQAANPLVYPAPAGAGGSAWTSNIKGVNNVALRNLHIQ